MSEFAEQAVGREAELRRKKKAVEYREMARKLRSGELSGPPEPQERPPAPTKGQLGSKPPESEIKAIVTSLIHHSSVSWNDIGGLEETKQEVKFTLGITLARPPQGVRLQSWTKILFYGPPGTGKTLLAAATSNAVKNSEGVSSVFYHVKISNVLSKYFGESSRIISELYGTARDTSPSVVFLDEFESICGKRDSSDSGAERRVLSTLLSELDGLDQKGRSDLYVLTLAATNRPWDLDPAVLSRFEKKVLIPLPDPPAREAILRIHLEKKGFRFNGPYSGLAERTQGLSGRELERFAKQVVSHMIQEMNADIPSLVDQGLNVVRGYQIRTRELQMEDFERALRSITPQTSHEEMSKYLQWKEGQEEA
jgi:SpoVK/Ycf46/Vps4 family AAA+-type ATPase